VESANGVSYNSGIFCGINLDIKGFGNYEIITSAYSDPTNGTY